MKLYLFLFFLQCVIGRAEFDGIDKFWKYKFGITEEDATLYDLDADGDGYSFKSESLVGTDPNDGTDYPSLRLVEKAGVLGKKATLQFPTAKGKRYTLLCSSDLVNYVGTGVSVVGNGDPFNFILPNGVASSAPASITAEFWANISSLGEIYENGVLKSPDGSTYLDQVSAPRFKGSNYAGRITTCITPPETGLYTFHVATTSEATLSIGENASSLSQILSVATGAQPLRRRQWHSGETGQVSEPIMLEEGQAYMIDLRYLAPTSRSFAQVGWSQAESETIDLITKEDVASQNLFGPYVEGETYLEHSYEDGQEGLFSESAEFAANLSEVGTRAEIFNSDTQSFTFSSDAQSHLYTSFLFNIDASHSRSYFHIYDGSGAQQGPVMIFQRLNAQSARIRFSEASQISFQPTVAFDTTYRLEIVATIASDGFTYATANETKTVSPYTYDVYISDLAGNLIAQQDGLTFRDGTNLETFRSFGSYNNSGHNITFDDWLFTGGQISGSGYLIPNTIPSSDAQDSTFFKVEVDSLDQDQDGVSDFTELMMSETSSLLFFDPQTVDAIDDAVSLKELTDVEVSGEDKPVLTLIGIDADAYEDNSPYQTDNVGKFVLTRTGGLAPLQAQICVAPLDDTGNVSLSCNGTCCSLAGSAGAEAAEQTDYIMYDEGGSLITGQIDFAFGEMSKTIIVKALKDDLFEYPETLNIQLVESDDYTLASEDSAVDLGSYSFLELDERNYSSKSGVNLLTTLSETTGLGSLQIHGTSDVVTWNNVIVAQDLMTATIRYTSGASEELKMNVLVDGALVDTVTLSPVATNWQWEEVSFSLPMEAETPHTVELVSLSSPDFAYHIDKVYQSTQATASTSTYIQLFDAPNALENTLLFTGAYSQDARATVQTTASGAVTFVLNGTRTELRITNHFSGLTSTQTTSHVHKANVGMAPGDVVYGITETPGVADSPPLLGNLESYVWDLTASSGAIPTNGGVASRQVIIDSLFGQNGESPLYFNVHTASNGAGEIWTFPTFVEGSTDDPGDAEPAVSPGDTGYPQLLDLELLEVDVRRFLSQATFGAYEEDVASLLEKIVSARALDPSYHRHTAFSEWIDQQMNPEETPQTFVLDLSLASHFQYFYTTGFFDANVNVWDTTLPELPETWPYIDRTNSTPELWHLSDNYPVTKEDFESVRNKLIPGHYSFNEVLAADWQLKLNGGDQLRQKSGYALQQILAVSDVDIYIRENALGSANYRDMLAAYSFSHYRDVLGYVNWSPVMGYWLSSIKNQKAIDLDGDGTNDSFPDENLARENMQLFSIGLFDLWSDGTLILDDQGLPQPTYTNDDIKEFAKVITGQSNRHFKGTGSSPTWGGQSFDEISYETNNFNSALTSRSLWSVSYHYPMKVWGEHHSPGIKTFAGTTIDNTTIADADELAIADIEGALDWLAGKPNDGMPDFNGVSSHVSTPAFISKLLIQRFTTSNPSKDYLHRVATVFKNSEGHLGETIKALLLDPEARNVDLTDPVFGLKKSPIEAYMQALIAMEGKSSLPLYNTEGITDDRKYMYLESYGYPESQLTGQRRDVRFMQGKVSISSDASLTIDPFYAQTVFNFYQPDYTKSGVIADSGLVAPEMQIMSEPEAIRNINYFQQLIFSDAGIAGTLLARSEDRQKVVFSSLETTENLDHITLPFEDLVGELYSSDSPVATDLRTQESLADEMLIDALDKRLTSGMFKLRYPYDTTDGVQNPREIIIDTITASFGNPYDGVDDLNDRILKLKEALYLMLMTPEYQVRK